MAERKFCPKGCEHLDPTEEEQRKTVNLDRLHQCKKFGVMVYHGPFHPRLLRCLQCAEEARKEHDW